MSDMTTAVIEQRLATLEEVLTLCQAAISEQNEALRTQTEMLTALWRELTKEPGPKSCRCRDRASVRIARRAARPDRSLR